MEIAQDRAEDALYRKGFLCIEVPFEIKKDWNQYSLSEIGTLVHEYVHFLQNISTPWGLYESMAQYDRMSSLYKQLQEDNYPILYVPVEEKYLENHKHVEQMLHYGRGMDKDSTGQSVYNLHVHQIPEFHVTVEPLNGGGHEIYKTIVSFKTQLGTRSEILFGAWAIKESMAALMQEKVDPDSPRKHAQIPYDLVRMLCRNKYPSTADDNDKLIALCYASLFTLCPGKTFIDLAEYWDRHGDLNADSILNYFFSKDVHLKRNGSESVYSAEPGAWVGKHFEDWYKDLANAFIKIVGLFLGEETSHYVKRLIEESRFRKDFFPLLWFTGERLTRDQIKKFMDAAGYPSILGTEGMGLFPNLTEDAQEEPMQPMLNPERKEGAVDHAILLGHETIYAYLTREDGECPRTKQCQAIGMYEEATCKTTPWRRDSTCPMVEMAKLLNIDNKNIMRK